MEDKSREALIIAYYLSKFNKLALKSLGYDTFKEAFEEISQIINIKSTTIKNMRDEFDPIHDNNRVGWYQKGMSKSRKDIVDKYNKDSEEDLRKIVLEILYKESQGITRNDAINKKEIKVIENIKLEIEKINTHINSLGYIYTYEDLSNFYLSLKTKPFIILAGISGM